MSKFHLIRFAIIKYTSKSDKKISVTDRQTDWRTDRLTDICISRAAFAAEKFQLDCPCWWEYLSVEPDYVARCLEIQANGVITDIFAGY